MSVSRLPLMIAVVSMLAGCVSASVSPQPVVGYGDPGRATSERAVAKKDPAPGVKCAISNRSGLQIEWRSDEPPAFFVADAKPGTTIYVGDGAKEFSNSASSGVATQFMELHNQLSRSGPILFKYTDMKGQRQSGRTVFWGLSFVWRECISTPL
jgi:hypothetical protein